MGLCLERASLRLAWVFGFKLQSKPNRDTKKSAQAFTAERAILRYPPERILQWGSLLNYSALIGSPPLRVAMA